MRLSNRQAHVLTNLERVTIWPYMYAGRHSFIRYQLDGVECTAQITTLVVRNLVTKTPDGQLAKVAIK